MDAATSDSGAAATPGELGSAWKLVTALVVAALSALPFLGALDAGFLHWDDGLAVVTNTHIRSLAPAELGWMLTTFHMAHYTPVGWLSFALDYALWGLDPRGFHLTSVLLHAVNAALVLLLADRVLRRACGLRPGPRWAAAALAALLFGLHPLRTEPVAWVGGRFDLPAALFVLTSVWLYLRAQEPGAARDRWLALSVAAFAAALLSKATPMALPLVLLLLDVWPLQRLAAGERRAASARTVLLEKVPYLVLSLAAGLVAFAARSAHSVLDLSEYGPLRRVMQAAEGIARHPLKSLAPTGLTPLVELRPDFDPLAAGPLAALSGLVVLTVLLVLARRRHPAPLVAWLAYVVLVLPVSGIAQSGFQAVADRYSYVSCVPLAILAAGVAVGITVGSRTRSVLVGVLALAVLGGLGALSRAQTRVWHDSITLWSHVVELDPSSYHGRWMLGVSLHRAGRFAEALEQYDEALRLRAGVGDEEARYNRALSLLALGRADEAEAALLEVLQEHPTHLPALIALRDLCEASGRRELVLKLLVRSVHVDPDFVEGWLELCSLRLRSGRFEGALAAGQEALARAPDNPAAHARVGLALLYLERFGEAEQHLRRALELDPSMAPVHVNLGVSLERQGRLEEARASWAAALALDPTSADARRRLEASAP